MAKATKDITTPNQLPSKNFIRRPEEAFERRRALLGGLDFPPELQFQRRMYKVQRTCTKFVLTALCVTSAKGATDGFTLT